MTAWALSAAVDITLCAKLNDLEVSVIYIALATQIISFVEDTDDDPVCCHEHVAVHSYADENESCAQDRVRKFKSSKARSLANTHTYTQMQPQQHEEEEVDSDTVHAICNLFNGSHSFDELLEHNICFIKGVYPCAPYHLGAINAETIPIQQDLIALNETGFMTIDSQPAIIASDRMQREYVEGYILNTRMHSLLKQLRDDDLYYIVIEMKEDPLFAVRVRGASIDPMTQAPFVTLSRARQQDGTWYDCTRASLTVINDDHHFEQSAEHVLSTQCTRIRVMSKDYSNIYLIRRLIRMLEAHGGIGPPPVRITHTTTW